MAVMIPNTPYETDKKSHEGDIFKALSELTDDYYVFHSVKINATKDGALAQRELDFVVFNPSLGILCIEAKAGQVQYKERNWYYANGEKMKHGGPFIQSETAMHALRDAALNIGGHVSDVAGKCLFKFCVWFPTLPQDKFDSFTLPTEINRDCVLTADDLKDPRTKIDKILKLPVQSRSYSRVSIKHTPLDYREKNTLLNGFFCPHFNVMMPSLLDYQEQKFKTYLKEQLRLLDYLEEQREAAINGAAGTGKTCIAIEKARRCSENGSKVLFLCYNTKLKEYLKNQYRDLENVDFQTVDSFVKRYMDDYTADDYSLVIEGLNNSSDDFPFVYDHVIVDEGQDFSAGNRYADGLLETLKNKIILEKEGNFYIFYDTNQLVQGQYIPRVINDSTCKLTLFTNCRNSAQIADTTRLILAEDNKFLSKYSLKNPVDGSAPVCHFCEPTPEALFSTIDKVIDKLTSGEIPINKQDIVILSLLSGESEEFKNLQTHYSQQGLKDITTARKFKGLEAVAVIVVDINAEDLFGHEASLLLYVASSRAKLDLHLILQLSDEECVNVLKRHGRQLKNNERAKNLKKKVSNLFKCAPDLRNSEMDPEI